MTRPSDEWVDAYIDSHPDSCIEDAERAWWDQQVDAENPEVGKLNAEQEKVARDLMRGKAVDAYGKTRKRERKPNADKAWVMARIFSLLEGYAGLGELSDVAMDNPERAISYTRNGKRCTLSLIEHRTPKG